MPEFLDALTTGQYLKRLYEKLMEPLLWKFHLTQAQADVLLFLENHPECDTAKEIVELRCLTKSHVSAAVDQLIARGFLIQKQDTTDRRRMHLVILEPAHEVIQEGKKLQALYKNLLYKNVLEDEAKQLHRLMKQIRKNAETALLHLGKETKTSILK